MNSSLYNEPNHINDLLRAAHPYGGALVVDIKSPNGGDGIVQDTIENQLHKLRSIYKYKAASILDKLASDIRTEGDFFVATEISNIVKQAEAISVDKLAALKKGGALRMIKEMEDIVDTEAEAGIWQHFPNKDKIEKVGGWLNDLWNAIHDGGDIFLIKELSDAATGKKNANLWDKLWGNRNLEDIFPTNEPRGLAAYNQYKSLAGKLNKLIDSVLNEPAQVDPTPGNNRTVDPSLQTKTAPNNPVKNDIIAPSNPAASPAAQTVSPIVVKDIQKLISQPTTGKFTEDDLEKLSTWLIDQHSDPKAKFHNEADLILNGGTNVPASFVINESLEKAIARFPLMDQVLRGLVKADKEPEKPIYDVSFVSPITGQKVEKWDFASTLSRAKSNPFIVLRNMQGLNIIPKEWKDNEIISAIDGTEMSNLFNVIQQALIEGGASEETAQGVRKALRSPFDQMAQEMGLQSKDTKEEKTVVEWCSEIEPDSMKYIRTSTNAMKELINWFFTNDYGTKIGIVIPGTAKRAVTDIRGAIQGVYTKYAQNHAFGKEEQPDPTRNPSAGTDAATKFESNDVGSGDRAKTESSPWAMYAKKWEQSKGETAELKQWSVSLMPGSPRWENVLKLRVPPPPLRNDGGPYANIRQEWVINFNFWNKLTEEQQAWWKKNPLSSKIPVSEGFDDAWAGRQQGAVQTGKETSGIAPNTQQATPVSPETTATPPTAPQGQISSPAVPARKIPGLNYANKLDIPLSKSALPRGNK